MTQQVRHCCQPVTPPSLALAPAQKLRNLDALRALEVRYAPCAAYSMRLFAVRLAELLHCPRLTRLRLVVPALHDSTDGTVFLSHLFMAQLRGCALRELDITLLTDAEGRPRSPGVAAARGALFCPVWEILYLPLHRGAQHDESRTLSLQARDGLASCLSTLEGWRGA